MFSPPLIYSTLSETTPVWEKKDKRKLIYFKIFCFKRGVYGRLETPKICCLVYFTP